MLNNFTIESAEQTLAEWKKFGEYIIVKYNDLVVKPEKDGRFERTSTGIGAPVLRPGYPVEYKREIIKQTGDKYLIHSAE